MTDSEPEAGQSFAMGAQEVGRSLPEANLAVGSEVQAIDPSTLDIWGFFAEHCLEKPRDFRGF
jgi:hypothetical protein